MMGGGGGGGRKRNRKSCTTCHENTKYLNVMQFYCESFGGLQMCLV